MQHAACGMQHPAKIESFQSKPVMNDPQARRLPNPEVATKHLARTERPFFKHRANCSRNIICQFVKGEIMRAFPDSP
jgi:hypothetical protein